MTGTAQSEPLLAGGAADTQLVTATPERTVREVAARTTHVPVHLDKQFRRMQILQLPPGQAGSYEYER